MSQTVIELSGVTKHYRGSDVPAVFDLSLHINEGSVYGLLGTNGAGKSTTIMMLCGLVHPDKGEISVFSKDIKSNGSYIRSRIGVATQEIALFSSLTAFENLVYFGKMYGLPGSVIRMKAEEYLNTFGLKDKAHKQVKTFSGGMKRRLNLISALLHNPAVLILDEPTAGVDVQSRNMIIEFLSGLKKQNITILYSSHYLEEAERICTHIGIIDEGKLLAEGKPAELLKQNNDCQNLEQFFLKLTGRNIRD